MIDKIVVQGDAMYHNALADGRIPDAETLSVDDLPFAVGWACEVVAKNSVAAESKQSESVMAASEPQCNANENCYSQPSSVMAASEPQCKANENQTWFIKYGNEFQGAIKSGHEIVTLFIFTMTKKVKIFIACLIVTICNFYFYWLP